MPSAIKEFQFERFVLVARLSGGRIGYFPWHDFRFGSLFYRHTVVIQPYMDGSDLHAAFA